MDRHCRLYICIAFCCYYVWSEEVIRFQTDCLLSPYGCHNQTTYNHRTQDDHQVKNDNSIVVTTSHGQNSSLITLPIATTKHFSRDFSVSVDSRTSSGHITFVNNPLRTVSVLEPLENGGCSKMLRATVPESSKQRNCFVSANAGFYDPDTNQCLGNIVSDGRMVQRSDGQRSVHFGIRKDGSLVFGYLSENDVDDRSNPFVQLISGVGWLLRNGEVYVDESKNVECDSEWSAREIFGSTAGRTVIGSDDIGRVVIAHVDGKTHESGATLTAMAEFLKELGVVNAINLDGGGSSTYVINGTVVSNPADICLRLNDPQYTCIRPVSTIICSHEPDCLPTNCNYHGDCVVGICQCHDNWKGVGCDQFYSDSFGEHDRYDLGECTVSSDQQSVGDKDFVYIGLVVMSSVAALSLLCNIAMLFPLGKYICLPRNTIPS